MTSMNKKHFLLVLWLLLCATVGAQVFDLRTDGRRNPLTVDNIQPRFGWKNTLQHTEQRQSAYQIEVASDEALLTEDRADMWNSGKVVSSQQVMVPYEGAPLRDRHIYYWRVRTWDENDSVSEWSEVARFGVGPLKPLAGEWIGCREDGRLVETPMFRTLVEARGDERVVVYVNSRGYHELYWNGELVGDKVLQPAVSQLDCRTMIVAYDVTPLLRRGRNELMLMVGQGWGRVYGTDAAAQVEVVDAKGDRRMDVSDGSWLSAASQYSYSGSWQPLQFGGEHFDARREPQWKPATLVEVGKVISSPQQFDGNKIIDILEPIATMAIDDSTVVLDFGRVVTGWLRIAFGAMQYGAVATMEYSDHLSPKGLFEFQGECDRMTANGKGNAMFVNKFHYHAFRYVRVKGTRVEKAEALQISGIDTLGAAHFVCSDARLNEVHDLVKYTLQCLTYGGYMVDCPHLERMGYGGDGNSSTTTLQTMYEVYPTYKNWLTAWEDAMGPDGELAYVAPTFRTGGGPYWSGFIIKAPWRTYLSYGDIRIVEHYYGSMRRWLTYVDRYFKEGLLHPWPDNDRHMWFLGDWLAPEGVEVQGESALFVSNCFLADCLNDMAQMTRILGRGDEAISFDRQQHKLKGAIHDRFYHPGEAAYASGSTLDQSYALLTSITPDSTIADSVRGRLLADAYGRYKSHIAVGLMGVPIFTEWAIAERQSDLMATLLRQPDYPGYRYMMAQGATTTWESWKGERSYVHNCYNGIGAWFYQALAGIRMDTSVAGFSHFFIDPQSVEGVEWVRASQPTPYGTIEVEIVGNMLTVTIPVGTTATLAAGTPYEKVFEAGTWTVVMNW